MYKVLTIAGSDCSGGAGIQADLKTMAAFGVYGMSVITALTAQNTTGVFGIEETSPDMVDRQIKCIYEDIRPDTVKIGMVGSQALIGAIADKLELYGEKKIVLDPVMVSTSGSRLLKAEAVDGLKTRLIPMAALLTPNIPEAELLTGMPIRNREEMEEAAQMLGEIYGIAVLVKGGHMTDAAADVLFNKGRISWFVTDRMVTANTHGTGCTLSSAIACCLAQGLSLMQSVERAKRYLTRALKAGLDLGAGNGPVNHNVLSD